MPERTQSGGDFVGMLATRGGRTIDVVRSSASPVRATGHAGRWGRLLETIEEAQSISANVDSIELVTYHGSTPDLEELLRHHDVVSATLLGDDEIIAQRQRSLWLGIVVVALVWGCLTGLAFGVRGFFLAVPPAVLGCLAIVVLAATLWVLGRERR